MKLRGVVEDILFRNEENGYTVLTLDADGEPETVVGNFPVLVEGEVIEAEGEYRTHAKYGRQFSAVSLVAVRPDTEMGIIRFLSGGLIPGVGEVTATRMVQTFGEKTIDVLEQEPDKLARIKGISVKRAHEIHDAYMAVAGMRSAMIYLQSLGLGSALSVRVYKEYGPRTEAVIRANPYKLVEDVDGVGFLTADRIAYNMGIREDSEMRYRAGLVHLVNIAADQNGHTYMPVEEVVPALSELLRQPVTEETVIALCKDLTLAGQLKLLTGEDGRIVAPSKLYALENGVADRLMSLIESSDDTVLDADKEIDFYQRDNGVEFHEVQREAIRTALTRGVAVITGGPGTGKTTIIKCVLSVLKKQGHTVQLLAPTGRAAKRMTEATGYPASTVHRALQAEGEGGRFSKNETNPIEATAVIVDEMSMVDVYLAGALLRALRAGTKLLLVGDRDQLPSVGPGNVFSDIMESGVVPTVALTQIYRQALSSRIVTNAHRINSGQMPVSDNGASSDFFILTRATEDIAATVVEMISTRLPSYLGIDPLRIQVLAPMKAGAAGVNRLNKDIQQVLNPPKPGKAELTHGETVYREGDKVMHIVNDYDIVWTKKEDGCVSEGSGVFNGDIGAVAHIFAGEMEVLYEDGKAVRYTNENLDELMLSYAITVHKSQGCEFDAVVMPIVGGSPAMLTKNLLYTGITRAKRMVVLIGEKYHLERMVTNDFTKKRYSRLKNRLQSGNSLLT